MPRPRTSARRAALTSALLALAVTGCTSQPAAPVLDAAPAAVQASPAAPVAPLAAPSSAAPTVSPTPKASSSPTGAASPAAPAFSFDTAAVQTKLKAQKYYIGAVDGRRGSALRSAVMAFQKVNGLGADGAVGPATLKALDAPKAPVLKGSSPANRVEVDLTRQVAYVVKGGAVARIVPVSSGNGATYEQKDGSTARALTPVGYYKVQRRIIGERKADLGTLYDPQYFYKGWAIHGSNSVPAGPASHGCVRVTRADAKYLLDAISVGTTVYLYGGQHVFKAGSSAPGTDAPTGDTAGDTSGNAGTEPSPTSTRTSTARPTSSSTPQPAGSPTTSSSPSSTPSPRTTSSPSPAATAR